MEDTIELTDGTVTLRRYRAEDTEPVYRAVRESIEEISPWMPWCYEGYSFDDSKTQSASRDDAWAKGKEYTLVILSHNDGLLLGVCGLNHFDNENRFANVGYWVRIGKTKHGVATSAILLLARFGFEELKLNRIGIVVSIEKKPSQRVAEKTGATQEGVLRKRLVVRDRVYDAVMYSLIPKDIIGIIIAMFYKDHAPPHFHAIYGEYEITVEIHSGVISGRFPRRALRLVLEWLELHKDELLKNQHLVEEKKPLKKIAPLEQ